MFKPRKNDTGSSTSPDFETFDTPIHIPSKQRVRFAVHIKSHTKSKIRLRIVPLRCLGKQFVASLKERSTESKWLGSVRPDKSTRNYSAQKLLGVGYGAAFHGWRLEYEEALPPYEWGLQRARERGSSFHIVCLLFIRGLGLGSFGRLSDSLADLREAMRLSELNHERYWLPRLPNTLEFCVKRPRATRPADVRSCKLPERLEDCASSSFPI